MACPLHGGEYVARPNSSRHEPLVASTERVLSAGRKRRAREASVKAGLARDRPWRCGVSSNSAAVIQPGEAPSPRCAPRRPVARPATGPWRAANRQCSCTAHRVELPADRHGDRHPIRTPRMSTPMRQPRDGATQLAFTSSQAASYLGVSLATVRRWSNAGVLRGSRTPGGQRRFSRDQLDTFLRSLDRSDGGDNSPSAR
jgi:excisionase family DNA binding protein